MLNRNLSRKSKEIHLLIEARKEVREEVACLSDPCGVGMHCSLCVDARSRGSQQQSKGMPSEKMVHECVQVSEPKGRFDGRLFAHTFVSKRVACVQSDAAVTCTFSAQMSHSPSSSRTRASGLRGEGRHAACETCIDGERERGCSTKVRRQKSNRHPYPISGRRSPLQARREQQLIDKFHVISSADES